MKPKIIALMAAGALWASCAANGASLLVVGGYVNGAYDVEVGGLLYDVEFVDGSCATLFGGCDAASDFAFDQAGSIAASSALLSQVFLDGASNVMASYAFNATLDANDAYGTSLSYGNAVDTTPVANIVYARWSRVPEPNTLALLGLGLVGLALMRWRRA